MTLYSVSEQQKAVIDGLTLMINNCLKKLNNESRNIFENQISPFITLYPNETAQKGLCMFHRTPFWCFDIWQVEG